MATNEQIIERIDKFEINVEERFDKQHAYIKEVDEKAVERDRELDAKVTHNDEAIRGNGHTGLRAQVSENTKAIARMEKYSQAVLLLVVGEIIVRVIGLITIP